MAVAVVATSEAVESARLLGRLHRSQGEWDEAIRWYEGARTAAQGEGDHATEAIVIDGLAHALRDKGNLPAARELLHEGLQVAEESGDDYSVASIYHALMSTEQRAGRLPQAVAHGWRALNLHRQEETRYYVLGTLAGCLVKMGELDAAEDSFAVVAERVERPDWRYAALEMLAHISSLRGHRDVFDERVASADGADWKSGASVPVHAEILQFRGMSWKALGNPCRRALGWKALETMPRSMRSIRCTSSRKPCCPIWATTKPLQPRMSPRLKRPPLSPGSLPPKWRRSGVV